MRARAVLLALTLVACARQDGPDEERTRGAGAELEQVAVQQGLVTNPAAGSLVGTWARETDRLCIVSGDVPGSRRIGVVTDYGDGQGCTASGPLYRQGASLRMAFGDCRIEARYDGERIVFPATVPDACRSLCRGRASLAALEVERQSASESEATMVRGRGGTRICS